MNEDEWRWMKMNEDEWRWMKMNEDEWTGKASLPPGRKKDSNFESWSWGRTLLSAAGPPVRGPGPFLAAGGTLVGGVHCNDSFIPCNHCNARARRCAEGQCAQYTGRIRSRHSRKGKSSENVTSSYISRKGKSSENVTSLRFDVWSSYIKPPQFKE